MVLEHGIAVEHSTVHRWALKLLPVMEKAFRRFKRTVGKSGMMDETHIRANGEWRYLCRAVDKAAARRYFEKAIAQNGEPEIVTIDKSGSNLAALQALNAEREKPIKIRQNKYLNNIVEQDHRAIKRRTRPMTGFKNFRCARIILAGVEIMHMNVKGQMKSGATGKTPLNNPTPWQRKQSASRKNGLFQSSYRDRALLPDILQKMAQIYSADSSRKICSDLPFPVGQKSS
ncbi:transposase-like protein [Paraburkholderia sp. BL21I4N1]|nr:transposase-like protein [Paraburkholderia sp. BL21I4N1]